MTEAFTGDLSCEEREWLHVQLLHARNQARTRKRQGEITMLIDCVVRDYSVTKEAYVEMIKCLFINAQANPGSRSE